VTATAVEGLEGVDIDACKQIASSYGVAFRKRVLGIVGLSLTQMIDNINNPKQWASPSLWRRLAAILYDTTLVAAVLLMAMALVVVPIDMFFGSENFDASSLRSNPLYLAYLFCIMVGFHILFWMRGGQTLGMKAWRLKVVRDDGEPLKLKDALLRYFAAILSWIALGLGFIWILFNEDGLAWHDRISKTRLVILEKK
jgi:uncharacterized RDD family membrane protein YckC